MERQRWFFIAVIGAILVVLAIFAVILLVEGDEEDQGENSGPPDPDSAPVLLVPAPAGDLSRG
jgi:hypothetical protein